MRKQSGNVSGGNTGDQIIPTGKLAFAWDVAQMMVKSVAAMRRILIFILLK